MDARLDLVEHIVGRRCAGREPHHVRGAEPLGADVRIGLHVMHARAVPTARPYQFARVVARPASDDDNDVGLARDVDRGGLPVFGRLADGVDEAHLRLREPPPDQIDEAPHFRDRLRRLGGHAEAWALFERENVVIVKNDVEAIEIARQAADLDVIALPDDDDVIAVAGEGGDGLMRDGDERACGFYHREAQGAGAGDRPLGCAVRGHHQRRRSDICDVVRDPDPFRRERAEDRGVMDEVAENRERAGVCVLEGERDGIANAETHAEVGRTEDSHTRQLTQRTLYCKVETSRHKGASKADCAGWALRSGFLAGARNLSNLIEVAARGPYPVASRNSVPGASPAGSQEGEMLNVRFIRNFALLAVFAGGLGAASVATRAQAPMPKAPDVTFTKDIAPILQSHCQRCHHPDGGAPMSLTTYDEVRPYAKSMKTRTGLRWKRGAMPPWFVEKNIGIQKFKNDPSLNDEEVATIAKWVDIGAPMGNPADMPKPLTFDDDEKWTIGTPDVILKSPEVVMPANSPDRWTDLGLVPTGLTEDRYVSAVEVREINDIPKTGGTNTAVGGRFVFHHMTYSAVSRGEDGSTDGPSTSFPIHEVGRNADVFPAEFGRLLAAHSSLSLSAAHLHANGRETHAHLEFGLKFFPKDYKPMYRRASMSLGNGNDIDVKPNTPNQELHAYAVLQENTKIIAFEPHLHASGIRMCEEAIWGMNIQQLNCVGYDHNWVTQYEYQDDAAPLLPKGTIVHLIGFLDTSSANRNLVDPRNWTGAGRRSVANMFIDLGYAVSLTDDQFQAEMAKRRSKMSRNDYDIGCPLCWAMPGQNAPAARANQAVD